MRKNRTDSTILAVFLGSGPDFAMITLMFAALLSMIVIPKLLTALERQNVAKALLHMRETAMALDAYYVDHEAFPPSGVASSFTAREAYETQQIWQPTRTSVVISGVATANSFGPKRAGARRLVTFRVPGPGEHFATLTTPLAYLAGGFRSDPFASTRGASLGYFAHANGLGWILFSVGPDRDEHALPGPGEISPRVERLYDLVNHFPYMWEPPDGLIGATYDPTNGIASEGDIYWAGGN